MAYGKISDAQRAVIKKHVEGLVVHDLGAGSCEHSLMLVELGAASVVAIDKESMPKALGGRKISRFQGYFEHYDGDIDVAFVSWPINHEDQGLLQLVRRAKLVLYVGKNTDGSMCAWPGFFLEMSGRKILDYVPERPNTLIVYSDFLARRRKELRGEERAGATSFDSEKRWLTFEEAEQGP